MQYFIVLIVLLTANLVNLNICTVRDRGISYWKNNAPEMFHKGAILKVKLIGNIQSCPVISWKVLGIHKLSTMRYVFFTIAE